MRIILQLMSFIKKFQNILKFNKEPMYYPDRPNEVKYSNCSADKAREMLGYRTEFDVDRSLNRMVDFITKNGPKKLSIIMILKLIMKKHQRLGQKKFFNFSSKFYNLKNIFLFKFLIS